MKHLQKSLKKVLSLFLVFLMLFQCSVVSFATVPQETTRQETVQTESIEQLDEQVKKDKQMPDKEKEEKNEETTEEETTKTEAKSTQDSSKVNEKEEEFTSSVEETKESELIENSEETVKASKKSGNYEEEAEEIESTSGELLNAIDKNELVEMESTEKDILEEIEETLPSLDVEKGNCKITNEAKLKKAVIASQSEAEIEEEIKVKKAEKEIPVATPNTATFKAPANANYLTFTADQANSTIKLKWKSGNNVQTSTDGGANWTNYTKGDLITLTNIGDTVSFKGENVCTEYDAGDSTKQNIFTMTGKIRASGDVTSLTNGIGGDAALTEQCYYFMFYNCSALITAPNLPSTTVEVGCYCGMFTNCGYLTTVPSLPATEMKKGCYAGMFMECISITQAPALPATSLAENCYYQMFYGCTEMTEAPSLPATTLAKNCYQTMFYNCFKLAEAPSLPATTLAEGCYNNMFCSCNELTETPKLPATTLAKYCYQYMFMGCLKLTTAHELPATTLAEGCYDDMFAMCLSLNKVPSLPATKLEKDCYLGMFNQCTSLETAPHLPATTLVEGCYSYMFSDCSNLNVYEAKATNIDLLLDTTTMSGDLTNYAEDMFSGISAGGTTDTTPVVNKKYYVKLNKYTVTFDSKGGSSVASQTVADGGNATRPADPKKDGYTFIAWFEDKALSKAFDFNTPITTDTTLYAKWYSVSTTHLVTFDSNGGSSVASQKVKAGEYVAKPVDPTKSGYTFVNWYKESSLINVWDFNIDTVKKDTTLYAKWQKVSQGGGGSSSSSSGGSGSGTVSSGKIVNGEVIATAVPTTQVVAIAKTAATTQTINVQAQGAKWVKDPTTGLWMLSFLNKKGQPDTAKLGFVTLAVSNAQNQINTATYFFNQTGQMQTGWLTTSDGNKYFFDNSKTQNEGRMATGWKQVQSDWHYFKEDGSMMRSSITPDGYLVDAEGKWVNQANIAQAVQTAEVKATGGYAVATNAVKK